MTYFFETYGCQMNLAESAALALAARERGWSEAARSEDADLVLINTCAVRATAEARVMGRLAVYEARKRAGGSSPGGRPFTLVVTGCVARRLGGSLGKRFPGIDYVMTGPARVRFPLILEAVERGRPPDERPDDPAPAFSFFPAHHDGDGVRAFVPISHGCGNFCSYCIVPYVRGPEIPRDPAAILEEIRLVASRGVREITLLGQNVNSYRWPGGAAGVDFPGLLRLVAREAEAGRGPPWVRFLSSHPKDLSMETIEVMAAHPCFCRHLHLCVQHGSNAVLERMNRRYTREDYLGLAARLRAAMPDISLSTDILVGFPGETEADVDATLALMDEVRFLYAYMYHYNPREGTAAFDFPGRVPPEVKGRRLARVIATQKRHTAELLRGRVGAETEVLIEGISRKNADEVIGRTGRDEMAVFPGTAADLGAFRRVVLTSLRGNTFRARAV